MANYVTNIVHFKGDESRIEELRATVQDTEQESSTRDANITNIAKTFCYAKNNGTKKQTDEQSDVCYLCTSIRPKCQHSTSWFLHFSPVYIMSLKETSSLHFQKNLQDDSQHQANPE